MSTSSMGPTGRPRTPDRFVGALAAGSERSARRALEAGRADEARRHLVAAGRALSTLLDGAPDGSRQREDLLCRIGRARIALGDVAGGAALLEGVPASAAADVLVGAASDALALGVPVVAANAAIEGLRLGGGTNADDRRNEVARVLRSAGKADPYAVREEIGATADAIRARALQMRESGFATGRPMPPHVKEILRDHAALEATRADICARVGDIAGEFQASERTFISLYDPSFGWDEQNANRWVRTDEFRWELRLNGPEALQERMSQDLPLDPEGDSMYEALVRMYGKVQLAGESDAANARVKLGAAHDSRRVLEARLTALHRADIVASLGPDPAPEGVARAELQASMAASTESATYYMRSLKDAVGSSSSGAVDALVAEGERVMVARGDVETDLVREWASAVVEADRELQRPHGPATLDALVRARTAGPSTGSTTSAGEAEELFREVVGSLAAEGRIGELLDVVEREADVAIEGAGAIGLEHRSAASARWGVVIADACQAGLASGALDEEAARSLSRRSAQRCVDEAFGADGSHDADAVVLRDRVQALLEDAAFRDAARDVVERCVERSLGTPDAGVGSVARDIALARAATTAFADDPVARPPSVDAFESSVVERVAGQLGADGVEGEDVLGVLVDNGMGEAAAEALASASGATVRAERMADLLDGTAAGADLLAAAAEHDGATDGVLVSALRVAPGSAALIGAVVGDDPAWASVDQRLALPAGEEQLVLSPAQLTEMFGEIEPGSGPHEDLPPVLQSSDPRPGPPDEEQLDGLDEEVEWEQRPDAFTSRYGAEPVREWDVTAPDLTTLDRDSGPDL